MAIDEHLSYPRRRDNTGNDDDSNAAVEDRKSNRYPSAIPLKNS